MAATMIKSKPCRRRRSLLISDSMFHFRNIRELTCLCVIVCVTLSQSSLADDGYETEDFLKREYSLTKPYQGVGFSSSAHWDLLGTAMISPEHVRLTPDLQSRQGAVWSRFPCYIRDWELQMHFKIHGQGKKNLNGDGMAFWFTKERMNVGPVFGNMNQFTGLAIFVDTYQNEDKNHERGFPYISVMLGNGTLLYDHNRDGRTTELGGCTALVRNVNHDTFLLLRYYRNRLTLMMDIDGKREWKDCVDVSGLRLPLGYHFGASSVTGDLTDNHDLISMKLYQMTAERTPEEEEEEDVTVPMVENMTPFQVEVEEEETNGVQVFFTFFFSIIGLCVLGAIALVVYNRWKENSRKRFY